jgi:hypothetical protein
VEIKHRKKEKHDKKRKKKGKKIHAAKEEKRRWCYRCTEWSNADCRYLSPPFFTT